MSPAKSLRTLEVLQKIREILKLKEIKERLGKEREPHIYTTNLNLTIIVRDAKPNQPISV